MEKHWNYRLMAHEYANSTPYLEMHEVHYTDGVPTDYTINVVRIGGESIEDIKWALDRMKEAASKSILWYGDRFPEEYKSE